jgi:hypothetical protein
MKESHAWRILAEEVDAGRTRSSFLCINLDGCDGVFGNDAIATISRDLRLLMINRIRTELSPDRVAYGDFDIDDPKMQQSRTLACLMFSAIARDKECAR